MPEYNATRALKRALGLFMQTEFFSSGAIHCFALTAKHKFKNGAWQDERPTQKKTIDWARKHSRLFLANVK